MTRQLTLKVEIRVLRGFILFLAVFAALVLLAAPAIAQNPVPFVDQPLVPDATAPGGPAFTLTVDGAGFVAGSVVNWNGSPRATTFVSSSKLTAAILASDIAKASTASVTVVNPSPGGGASNTQSFPITVPDEDISTFLPGVTYGSGGSPPMSLAIADLNGDGKLDLVVANFCVRDAAFACPGGAGVVGVLLGNGDGTFQAAVDYASGGEIATSVAIADVNGDHIPDLVVVNCGPIGANGCQTGIAVVGVLLGNGDGTFRPAAVYETGWSGANSVAVADVNGDGKPDLVVAHIGGSAGGEGMIGVLLGNGDGTFQPAVTYDSGGEAAESVAVADVNGDGKLDLLVLNICAPATLCFTGQQSHGSVGVLLGNGDGTFQPVVTYDSGGYEAVSVAVADMNGDGKPDLLVLDALTTGEVAGVLLGNGDGTFQPAVNYFTGSGGQTEGSVVVADVNGDGKLDLLTTDGNSGSSNVRVLLGNGDGTFQAGIAYDSGGSTPIGLAVGDLNGDGLPDVAATMCPVTDCGPGEVGVLLHVGTTPTTTTLASTPNPSFFGQLVKFSAAVTSESGTPTGTVMFFDSSTALGSASMVNGKASISISTLVAGTHSITAVYRGTLKFSSSTSAPLAQVVNHALATTSITLVSSLNPSVYHQAVTFTATVSSPGGSLPFASEYITFFQNSNLLGTATLYSDVAALTTPLVYPGLHSITAVYGGDANFAASRSPGLLQAVDTENQSATAAAIASNLNPSMYGQKVTLTATVTTLGSATPTGRVNFWSEGSSLGSAPLDAKGLAMLTRSNLNAGSYPLTAVYLGDTNNGPSASPSMKQVVKETTSAATLTASPNPSTQGQIVTFTATITSPTVTPTGPVTFTVGTTVLGTAQLSGRKATFTTSTLPVGSSKVKATYYGDSNIAGSMASVTETVQQ